MEKRRGGHLFMILMILLLIIGLVVLIWGAATYVKPLVPLRGPQFMLYNFLLGGLRA